MAIGLYRFPLKIQAVETKFGAKLYFTSRVDERQGTKDANNVTVREKNRKSE